MEQPNSSAAAVEAVLAAAEAAEAKADIIDENEADLDMNVHEEEIPQHPFGLTEILGKNIRYWQSNF